MANAADILKSGKRRNHLTVAIHLGKTQSACAFIFLSQYEDASMNIQTVTGPGKNTSIQTPTTILLNSDLTFNSFGYNAENKYSELMEDDAHHDYHYFRHFNTMLHNSRNIEPDMMLIEDSCGREVKALTVYAMSIKYFKSQMDSRTKRVLLLDDEIRWILTVPAKCTGRLKQFVREASKMAGIKCENLDIVREPEAASSLLMHLPFDKRSTQVTEAMRSVPFAKGTKYMVVNAGGKTVQVSMYEVVDTDKLMELGHAKDLACGSNNVNDAFEQFFKDIIGPDVFDMFKRQYHVAYTDLCRDFFDTMKRTLSTNETGKITIKIPVELMSICVKTIQRVQNDGLKVLKDFEGKFVFGADKIRLHVDIFRPWFKEPCESIVQHVRECFQSKTCEGMNLILLVGGFSGCKTLQTTMKSTLSDKRIIIPTEPELAVLNGAVLYGHNPVCVERRRSLFSWK